MLWNIERIDEIYQLIISLATHNTCNILILTPNDCDSICATKSLTNLLKNDDIMYMIEPVYDTNSLEEISNNFSEKEDV